VLDPPREYWELQLIARAAPEAAARMIERKRRLDGQARDPQAAARPGPPELAYCSPHHSTLPLPAEVSLAGFDTALQQTVQRVQPLAIALPCPR